jgi:hypothetical protein
VTLHVVHYFVRSSVSPCLVLIGVSIIPNVDNALSLLADEGEWVLRQRLLLGTL